MLSPPPHHTHTHTNIIHLQSISALSLQYVQFGQGHRLSVPQKAHTLWKLQSSAVYIAYSKLAGRPTVLQH